MRALAYNQYGFTLTLTLSTPRPEAVPSNVIAAASKHEDWASRARVLLRQWRHCGPESEQVPAALRLQTYFPTHNASPLYALRTLAPAGSLREIDQDAWADVYRLRYEGLLVLLPAALAAPAEIAEAYERHLERAVERLFTAASLPPVYLPGEDELRIEDRTTIDLIAELGPAQGQGSYEVAVPSG